MQVSAEVVMRYLAWFEDWFGHFMVRRFSDEGRAGAAAPLGSAELSNEDLFYIAMLGPHV
jgi:hypothetical protein